MALGPCPECKTQVSTQARSCPDCGYPLREPTAQNGSRTAQLVGQISTAVILVSVFGVLAIRAATGPSSPTATAVSTAPITLPKASGPALNSDLGAATGTASSPKSEKKPPSGEMILIPAGTVELGIDGVEEDEKPPLSVKLKAFYLDITEVTLEAWNQCQTDGSCRKAPIELVGVDLTDLDKKFKKFCTGADPKLLKHPINCVSWSDASTFCKWAGKRLPTEAEWEYAARGGTKQKHPWGDGPPESALANHCGTECTKMLLKEAMIEPGKKAIVEDEDGFPATAPVRSFPKNPYGIFDLGGNVSEWVSDAYEKQLNITPPASGEKRVFKGSNWQVLRSGNTRIAKRWKDSQDARDSMIGFRCAKDGQ